MWSDTMGFFSILLLVVFILVCLLLIFIVIIQDEDSDSIGGIFASGAQSAFGSRTSSVVTKITYVLGALFFITAFALAVVNKSPTGNIEKVVQQNNQETGTTEWWNAPAQGTEQVQPSAPSTSAPIQQESTPAAP